METYDSKSCNALQKPYYRPIEAAIRWCNLMSQEVQILGLMGSDTVPRQGMFPYWPCLKANTEKIFDAIANKDIPCGRNGRTVRQGEQVNETKITVRHTDLKAWIAQHYPDTKPAFLFDETERSTHHAINADSFRALQADRDAMRTRLEAQFEKANADLDAAQQEIEKATKWAEKTVAELDSLRAAVDGQSAPGARAETTYMNIIGGLLGLMLGTTPGGQRGSAYESQAAIISALLAHHSGKPGIADSTLEQKFAEANRSIKAT